LLNEIIKVYPSMKVIKEFPPSGQKVVYLVNIDSFGCVVLKVIKKMDERIQREIDTVNQHDIVGAPRILEFASFDYNGEKQYYWLEEYIDGENLTNILKQGALPLSESLKLLKSLLITVSRLESLGIVHRDIKPDNIIRSQSGTYNLIDFGIARNLNLESLTLTEAIMGPHTPGYGAPELFQYNKININSKADLFSIGVVAYEAIFGKHPFITGKEADVNEIWYKTSTVVPKEIIIPGDTDSQLIAFIQTLMQKQVSKRPPNARKALEWYYAVCDTLAL